MTLASTIERVLFKSLPVMPSDNAMQIQQLTSSASPIHYHPSVATPTLSIFRITNCSRSKLLTAVTDTLTIDTPPSSGTELFTPFACSSRRTGTFSCLVVARSMVRTVASSKRTRIRNNFVHQTTLRSPTIQPRFCILSLSESLIVEALEVPGSIRFTGV